MRIKLSLISILLISANSIHGMYFYWSMTPQDKLFEGAESGKMELVEEALKEGANVNSKNNSGDTALILAVYSGENKIVEKLIDEDADVNLQDKWGFTALMEATSRHNNEIVKQLLNAGADVSIKNKWGQNAINIAIKNKNFEILKLLRDHLEQQKAEIQEYLPKDLAQITVEYLGYPEIIVKKRKCEDL